MVTTVVKQTLKKPLYFSLVLLSLSLFLLLSDQNVLKLYLNVFCWWHTSNTKLSIWYHTMILAAVVGVVVVRVALAYRLSKQYGNICLNVYWLQAIRKLFPLRLILSNVIRYSIVALRYLPHPARVSVQFQLMHTISPYTVPHQMAEFPR